MRVATPDSASIADPAMVSCEPGAAVEGGAVIASTGGVASMLNDFDTVAALPAASIALPVTVWLAPSLVNT